MMLMIDDHVPLHEVQFRGQDTNGRHTHLRAELGENFSHISLHKEKQISNEIMESRTVANTLHDLQPSKVPFQHFFELTDRRPMYHSARKMAPGLKTVIRHEIDVMLKAGIIMSANSAWSFPVVIPTKKMESRGFAFTISLSMLE